jgi:hypothetical protein
MVIPSHCEPWDRTAAEAMLMERAVSGPGAGGRTEIITHEDTGLLFAPRDPDSLAQAMERLLHDPQLRARLVENAYREARTRYSLGAYGGGIHTALMSAAAERKPSAGVAALLRAQNRFSIDTAGWWDVVNERIFRHLRLRRRAASALGRLRQLLPGP